MFLTESICTFLLALLFQSRPSWGDTYMMWFWATRKCLTADMIYFIKRQNLSVPQWGCWVIMPFFRRKCPESTNPHWLWKGWCYRGWFDYCGKIWILKLSRNWKSQQNGSWSFWISSVICGAVLKKKTLKCLEVGCSFYVHGILAINSQCWLTFSRVWFFF